MQAILRQGLVGVVAIGASAAALNAAAHHSFAMFDRTQELVMQGTVARWAFNSPHVAIYIENEDGELWAFEGAAPAHLVSLGINGFTFTPGDPVTVVMCPLRDGRPGGAIGYVIKAGDEGNFDAWFRPNDGGCGPSRSWGEWLAAGYRSRAEAEEVLGVEPDERRGGFGPPQ
ncbi:MAG: DUF6152 family protein [Gammaproteobacteria bacterium]|nr:DUF6152 family protein [Gammaproteobacteria bacterium]